MDKHADLHGKALNDLQQSGILMIDGHFDYGNGYHGRVYLNPHELFRHPSTIWRFAQDLIDLLPGDLVQRTQIVAGPVTGGALLAHTIAGLLDSRRSLTHPACSFAPFNYDAAGGFALRTFYRQELAGKRVLLADDVRNTGETFARCAASREPSSCHCSNESLFESSERQNAFSKLASVCGEPRKCWPGPPSSIAWSA